MPSTAITTQLSQESHGRRREKQVERAATAVAKSLVYSRLTPITSPPSPSWFCAGSAVAQHHCPRLDVAQAVDLTIRGLAQHEPASLPASEDEGESVLGAQDGKLVACLSRIPVHDLLPGHILWAVDMEFPGSPAPPTQHSWRSQQKSLAVDSPMGWGYCCLKVDTRANTMYTLPA
ncbi:uncharacterized protein B0I36DRAFT_434318 [Microdochium trichocladiopsis]|uniref:Uncharacterized protein n=1 Tax=Microdochium trichocladiopsis TaxID=1682393 RepID=A0A9P9BLQ3_9PEZI|nr:uncharacterized protein B0I36DRAFT_434318 [Microdochium trichocladiopsis]KAH7024655.1 hypothetical protein B0I36DRAFT_434318 [Microdochium trichocladiopsis]